MIIGCTGNYRKEEYFNILERIYSILSKSDVEILISDDLIKRTNIEIQGSSYNPGFLFE